MVSLNSTINPERRVAMKVRPSRIIVVFILLVVLPCSNALAGNRLTEEQALDVLMTRVQKDKLYDSRFATNCLSFLVEGKTKDYIDIAVREKHGGKCQGDPDTSPVVDRFRVHRSTRRIKCYESSSGEYQPYGAMVKARLENGGGSAVQ
jgi:hypothetical protein